ncbi:hypothetical protein K378_04700 [Streptomyces sp. Amel2xB2]|nr:hypothetical protein K378_04700 [Streptomyces sp. Amel2xB2]
MGRHGPVLDHPHLTTADPAHRSRTAPPVLPQLPHSSAPDAARVTGTGRPHRYARPHTGRLISGHLRDRSRRRTVPTR